MAEVLYLLSRAQNAHEPQHLTLGNFGATIYDETNEQWSSLRLEDADDSNVKYLTLLHVQASPDTGNETRAKNTASSVSNVKPLPRIVKLLQPYHSDVNSHPSATFADTSAAGAQCLFCYAHTPYQQGAHAALLPIAVSVPQPGTTTIAVRPVRVAKVSENLKLPMLAKVSSISLSLDHGSILGMSCSGNKQFIAIRQRRSTSICIIRISDQPGSDSSSMVFTIEIVLTIPVSRTGGHTHSQVAFNPKEHSVVGIVDEHGNWSSWELHGRPKLSSRILFTGNLKASGKLMRPIATPSGPPTPFLDHWHSICWLEAEESESQLVVVCNRRDARLFDGQGNERGEVDVRLGSKAVDNWILDIRPSQLDLSTCYVLTSTRVLVLRLSRQGSIELTCSWTHFHGRSMTLSLSVLEMSEFRCLILHDDNNRLATFIMRTSRLHGLVSLGTPQLLQLPESVHGFGIASQSLQVVELQILAKRKTGSIAALQYYVKLVAFNQQNETLDMTFSVNASLKRDADLSFERSCLRIANDDEWRIRSAVLVDEADELIDFVVPDEPTRVLPLLSRNWYSASNKDKRSQPSRNWEEVLAGIPSGSEHDSVEVVLQKLTFYPEGLRKLNTLADLMPDIQVGDIQDASTATQLWIQENVDDISGRKPAIFRSVRAQDTSSVQESYAMLLRKFFGELPRDLPDRIKVQIERLARQVAFDQCSSNVILTKVTRVLEDGVTADEAQNSTNQTSEQATSEGGGDITHDALRRYTSFTIRDQSAQSNTTTSRILAHLPTDSTDPATYSYSSIEAQLSESLKKQAFASLPERERRRVERANVRKEKKLAQQQRLRDAAITQNSYAPEINMLSSQDPDPREVQSSQIQPEDPQSSQMVLVPMTQPERGPHGERKMVVGRSGKRRKGF